ncbi:hypothetical protein I4U23_017629 [Adineta vaga]|nr:hypothetical protein I4U23_017629 [Adineta vaga]
MSSSNYVLLVIIIMDFSSTVLFICLIFFKCQVRGQENSALQSSLTVETQYLTFDMSQYGQDGGVFSSPNFPNNYPQNTILFYQFIASSDYRVVIEIDSFQIRGVTPQCTHDYLDVFINVTNFDFVHNVLNDQLLHRYCGRNKPPLLVSFTNLLLLGFFTEDTQTERGFNGSFRFIPAQPYRNNLQRQPCDYIFNSSKAKRGEFFSSTYPGTYLPWQFCNYSFIGLPGERIHIRFRDLILFKTPNTQHCAVDLIKVYDNILDPPELRRFLSSFRQNTHSDQQYLSDQHDQHHITDLCGTYHLPLDVYSTSNILLLYFIATHYAELTDEEQAQMSDYARPLWRKGFYAEYEFSSSLTKLDFIDKTKSNQYVSGTECDQTIKSFGQGHGIIHSPNWPHAYKPQTSCTTYLLGLDDRYTLENVEIEFDQFDIDCNLASLVIYNASRIYDYRLRSRPSSNNSPLVTTSKSPLFSNYYRQELDFKGNLSFCGHFKPEGRFVSQTALLKLSFIPTDRSGTNTFSSLNNGGKFQAKYKFVKSYHQVSADEYDGTNPNICNLSYYQSRTITGKFEPPRSSENDYFANSNCTFNFFPLNEHSRLLIWYDYFNIADDDLVRCPSDNLTYTYSLHSSSIFYSHPFHYCGYRNFPSPFLTLRSTELFRVHFRSNDDSETGLGFEGRYQFLNQSSSFFSFICRSPFDSIIYINETKEPSGNISTDGYPENVICEWSYVTTRGFQFLLELNLLQIEGSKTKDPPQGCQTAVLRIYSEGRFDELCGQQDEISYFTTDSNWFTIQFISLNRQTKELLRGFHLYWTVIEMKLKSTEQQCSLSNEYFYCRNTINHTIGNFCIHRSLVCDGRSHCQPLSNDDEHPSNCYMVIPSHSKHSSSSLPSSTFSFFQQHLLLIIIIFILCLTMLCIALILICLLIKMKRRQQDRQVNKSRRRTNQQDDFLLRKKSLQTYSDEEEEDDDEDNQSEFIATNRMEQAVTTV